MSMQDQRYWIGLSAAILLVYLIFFHLCLGANSYACIAIGIVSWVVWFGICYRFRAVFVNRFEYLIHQLVGLDILLEGFVPFHEGYGFYYCAASFWAVFLVYHFLIGQQTEINAVKTGIADSGV